MTQGAWQYRKELKRALRCGQAARRRLLARWDSSLAGFLVENAAPAFDEIAAAFGPPKEMAQTLMAELTVADIRGYQLQRCILQFLAGLCAAELLLFAVYVFVEKQKPIVFTEHIETFSPSTVNEEE